MRYISGVGASDLTRTGDLLITSEMHYRLCYTSIPRHYSGFSGGCQLIFPGMAELLAYSILRCYNTTDYCNEVGYL